MEDIKLMMQSELPQPILWNFVESDIDIHQGSTLMTWRWRFITLRWCHGNHANTITDVIAAKQTDINEGYVVVIFLIKYRYSDIEKS